MKQQAREKKKQTDTHTHTPTSMPKQLEWTDVGRKDSEAETCEDKIRRTLKSWIQERQTPGSVKRVEITSTGFTAWGASKSRKQKWKWATRYISLI